MKKTRMMASIELGARPFDMASHEYGGGWWWWSINSHSKVLSQQPTGTFIRVAGLSSALPELHYSTTTNQGGNFETKDLRTVRRGTQIPDIPLFCSFASTFMICEHLRASNS